MLAIDRLSVRYGPVAAVREVSLRVDAGEIVALLGANGAGKSSLLDCVVGLVPPAGGTVAFEGKPITGQAPERIVRAGITLVPEGRRVFPRLTVADNLRVGAVARRDDRVAEDRRRVLELFPILESRAGQQAGTLSGGQQQMLAIGRALMSGPRLLLLDEPSLGLAPIVVDEIFALVRRLAGEGMTVLLVEQNAKRALELADRAYVLATGRLEREGTADELLASTDIERVYLGASA